MSFQNNNAVDTYQDFMLPTALDSDFSSEDLELRVQIGFFQHVAQAVG